MTGRLNPHRYDLGELRDAVREPRRSDVDDPTDTRRTDSRPAAGEQSVPVEPATNAAPPQRTESGPAEDTQQADEVEAYLRARHRGRRDGPDRSDTGRREGDRRRAGRRGSLDTSDPGTAPNAAAFLAELSAPGVSKPYLDRLPDAYTAQLEVFEWLDGLLERAGRDGTMSALEYYESIGWLSERSREELMDVASGLSAATAAEQPLDVDDHRESLVYVARLARRRQK